MAASMLLMRKLRDVLRLKQETGLNHRGRAIARGPAGLMKPRSIGRLSASMQMAGSISRGCCSVVTGRTFLPSICSQCTVRTFETGRSSTEAATSSDHASYRLTACITSITLRNVVSISIPPPAIVILRA